MKLSLLQLTLHLDLRRLVLERDAMSWLATWGFLNVAVAMLRAGLTRHPKVRGFWIMSGGYGAVNLALAIFALLQTLRGQVMPPPMETFKQMEKMARLFALSTGLDVAYMSIGWALWERGRRVGRELLMGMGSGMIVQGLVLFFFDGALFWMHTQVAREALTVLLRTSV